LLRELYGPRLRLFATTAPSASDAVFAKSEVPGLPLSTFLSRLPRPRAGARGASGSAAAELQRPGSRPSPAGKLCGGVSIRRGAAPASVACVLGVVLIGVGEWQRQRLTGLRRPPGPPRRLGGRRGGGGRGQDERGRRRADPAPDRGHRLPPRWVSAPTPGEATDASTWGAQRRRRGRRTPPEVRRLVAVLVRSILPPRNRRRAICTCTGSPGGGGGLPSSSPAAPALGRRRRRALLLPKGCRLRRAGRTSALHSVSEGFCGASDSVIPVSERLHGAPRRGRGR